LVDELDRLRLRENTVILFTGDTGTARFGVEAATVNGRSLSGMKATMLEGGSRVPLIVNWPGTTPAGKVNHDLVDFSDFFVTIAELSGAPLPGGVKLDGRSFAAPVLGRPGTPREWVYVELNGRSYVRNARYKLTNRGDLLDLAEAPYKEIALPADKAGSEAAKARSQLQAVLDQLPTAPGQADPQKKQKKKAAKKARK
jgi:arylsulfatase A